MNIVILSEAKHLWSRSFAKIQLQKIISDNANLLSQKQGKSRAVQLAQSDRVTLKLNLGREIFLGSELFPAVQLRKQLQCVCHDTLPWLISVPLDATCVNTPALPRLRDGGPWGGLLL